MPMAPSSLHNPLARQTIDTKRKGSSAERCRTTTPTHMISASEIPRVNPLTIILSGTKKPAAGDAETKKTTTTTTTTTITTTKTTTKTTTTAETEDTMAVKGPSEQEMSSIRAPGNHGRATPVLGPLPTPQGNVTTAREKQLAQHLELGPGASVVRLVPWPKPTKETLLRIQSRPRIFSETTSPSYIEAQTRMSFLLDVSPAARWEVFETHCYIRNLQASTAMSNWTSLLALMTALGIERTTEDQRATRVLKMREARHMPLHAFPLVATMVQSVVQKTNVEQDDSLRAMIFFAWTNGQRFPDVIQIATSQVQVECQAPNIEMSAIVSLGKTVRFTGPYSLHVQGPAATMLHEVWLQAKAKAWLYLLSPSNSEEDRSNLSARCNLMLTKVDPRLGVRSIRRGGLQQMATLGMSLQQIIVFSKHRSEKTLMGYLDDGRICRHRATGMIEVTNSLQNLV